MSFLLLSRPSRRLPWIVTALLLLLGTGTAAYAFWASSTSSSNAAATADMLSPGSKPAVTAAGSALTVTWAGGTTVKGRAATGYTVARYSAATGGTATPATGGCAGTVTTLTCTEQSVPGGIWYYTVTPAIALWTGAESPRSNGTSSDSTAPVATVSGISPTPNAAGWNNTSPVSVTVTADDGPAGSGVASISYALDGGAQQTVSGAVAVVPVSGDGTHTLTYFATDKVGNAGSAKSQTVRIDTQAPAAPVFTPTPGSVYSGNVGAVPLTGTAEAGSRVTLVASDAGSVHSVPATVTASGTGTWSASLDLTSLNQGNVTYSATATDAAGNTGPARTATATKDTVAPAAAQFSSVPQYVNSAGVGSVPVSGTAETGAGVTVSAMSPGSAAAVTARATATASGWAVSLNLTSLRDGTVTYTVTVTDPAGNTSAPATTTDTKDTVAPVLKLDTLPNVLKGNVTSYSVSGTNDSGQPVNLTVSDASTSIPATTSGSSWNTGSLNLSTLQDSSPLNVPSITIVVTTADAAGNTTTVTTKVIKDTAPPTVTAVTLVNGGGSQGLGKAEEGDSLTIQFSEQIDATKICSSWTNSGVQTLSGNNNVMVKISVTNQLTVTSSTCPGLNLGSVYLGSNAMYTSAGALSFGGNGNSSNWSTVTWDGSTTLTIRLGKISGSSGTTTAPDAPTYTPGTGFADPAGNPLGSFLLTATSRF
ncbi:Ig-like domain-containing protein [Pseudarthrobacter sp. efr-133-R2A-89]|uniref:OmpL47-type beta-barrel domain-containing protein n=1 Tax=Pseudarthrobacter sp. efr-133-R2A-89 TaxID=3040302 RepID=UPI0025558F8C|nr:Ig-like domain-containing protein [Pseudarthrobacter sp. efr-133-R2A-89]